MKLVQLTMNKEPLILDALSIALFHEDDQGTWIELKNGSIITVDESVTDVCRALCFEFKEEEIDL